MLAFESTHMLISFISKQFVFTVYFLPLFKFKLSSPTLLLRSLFSSTCMGVFVSMFVRAVPAKASDPLGLEL